MTDILNIEIPEFASSFSELARLLKTDRGHLREIRNTDPRFPQATDRGWPVVKAGLLLELRRVERMSDSDFAAGQREGGFELLAKLDSSELDFGTRNDRAREVFEAMANDFDGRTARNETISDLSQALRGRCGTPHGLPEPVHVSGAFEP